jgi:hypothetical protein
MNNLISETECSGVVQEKVYLIRFIVIWLGLILGDKKQEKNYRLILEFIPEAVPKLQLLEQLP